LPAAATVADGYRQNQPHSGRELYLVIMFVDMRGSTLLAEQKMPFDTVFLINRFIHAVSSAVVKAGGAPNQILGDGLLALFGLQTTAAEACRQATTACAIIADNVEKLNTMLVHELPSPIQFGIGIHAGPVIIGNIGYEEYAAFTAIGDPVNVAARLQDLTKPLGCEVLMSEEVYRNAGFSPSDLPQHEVEARGRAGGLQVRSAVRASKLAALPR
jgi:adenylate cyclase